MPLGFSDRDQGRNTSVLGASRSRPQWWPPSSAPRRVATRTAVATLAPVEVPAKMASSVARRRVMSLASSVVTAKISSTSLGFHRGGIKPMPIPAILCEPEGLPERTADSAGSTAKKRAVVGCHSAARGPFREWSAPCSPRAHRRRRGGQTAPRSAHRAVDNRLRRPDCYRSILLECLLLGRVVPQSDVAARERTPRYNSIYLVFSDLPMG